MRLLFVAAAFSGMLTAQSPCPSTPTYSLCEIIFDLSDAEAEANPNPYVSVHLQAEFRSPRHRTFLMPAFWDGGRRLIIRFAPIDAGTWTYRITSNIERFSGKQDTFKATASDSPGFIRPANVHHWANTAKNTPHLWMGDTMYRFAYMDPKLFTETIDARSAQKFTHIRGLLVGQDDDQSRAFPDPDQPNPDHFREIDQRILYMNRKGIVADLVLAGDRNHLAEMLPMREQRERFVRYLIARYSPMNITWQGVQEFEEYKDGRELLKEIGLLLKELDPYQHPRSTHTVTTSSPLLPDGWMDYVVYQSSDNQLGSIEHQLYAVPFVNNEFGYEDSGAGKSHPHHVDTDTLRKHLWNASMNGQYPTFGNTGTYGGRNFPPDAKFLDSPGARQMTVWFDFMSRTRFWELEPYFDIDGGRCIALQGIEYVIYIEKPSGPVEILVERHRYNIAWVNPVTGETLRQKDIKSNRIVLEPPGAEHDWVLHISREGRKQGMRSYKFESRPILMQEVEQNPQRAPFEIVEPAADEIPFGQPVKYMAKIKRETRATRSMMYLWTGEVVSGGHGSRVLGTGAEGTWQVPPRIAGETPAVLNVRLTALNANGKAYSIDRIYRLK